MSTTHRLLRVKALAPPMGACNGCVGCAESGAAKCVIKTGLDDEQVQDWIFIEDTEEKRTAYAALVLEHGLREPRQGMANELDDD